MKNRLVASLVLLAIPVLLPFHAHAQWSPSASLDLGFGFGQMALSQAALESARRLGEESGKAFENESGEFSEPDFEPLFVPDPALTRIVEQRFIAFIGGDDPSDRATMAEEVASGRYQEHFLDLMERHGLEPRLDDLLEVTAARYVTLWEIIHGRTVAPEQARAVRRQLLAQFSDDFWMRRMDDAEKQELAETFVLHVAAADIAHAALMAGDDADLLARYRAGVQENLLPGGPRLDRMEIAETGFVRP